METESISKKLLVFNALLVLGILVVTFCTYNLLTKPATTPAPQKVVKVSHAFDNLTLEAKSVYVFDLEQNKVIFQKNALAQLPLASLTKLMTALVATELLPKNSDITINKNFLAEDGDTGLLDGETWNLKNLLDFSLVVSSNDGARAIASVAGAFEANTTDYNIGLKDFISKMNAEAKRLGLAETYFVNESGLDESDTQSGGYGSAVDVANLLKYILANKPELLEATKLTSSTFDSSLGAHTAVNTDTEISKIPGLIASKTGYTTLAGGNLAIAFDAGLGHPIIAVVLGSSQDGRFSDMSQLVKATLSYVND